MTSTRRAGRERAAAICAVSALAVLATYSPALPGQPPGDGSVPPPDDPRRIVNTALSVEDQGDYDMLLFGVDGSFSHRVADVVYVGKWEIVGREMCVPPGPNFAESGKTPDCYAVRVDGDRVTLTSKAGFRWKLRFASECDLGVHCIPDANATVGRAR